MPKGKSMCLDAECAAATCNRPARQYYNPFCSWSCQQWGADDPWARPNDEQLCLVCDRRPVRAWYAPCCSWECLHAQRQRYVPPPPPPPPPPLPVEEVDIAPSTSALATVVCFHGYPSPINSYPMEYFVGSDTATERGASSSSEWDLVDSLENTQPADEGTLTSATLSSDGDAVISIPFTACAADATEVANYEQAMNSYENRSEQDHASHDGGMHVGRK